MIRWVLILAGFIMILGASACNSNDLPAETPAGFVHTEVSSISSPNTPIPVPSSSPTPTVTRVPTDTPKKPFDLPAPTSHLSPTAQTCQETVGLIEDRQLESDLLEEPLVYSIYLPPCYSEQLDRRYPVLYLFHGQTYSNKHWIDLGATSIADSLISGGEITPLIMVFPFDRNHYKSPIENKFGEAVLLDLIPTIDYEFRTIPAGSSRAIGGISRGGNWAAHISLQHPELFSAIGLHSTPIFSTDTNKEIIEWLEGVPVDELPRLFLDIGQNDRWLNYTLIFAQLLNDASIPHEWHLYPGYHEDAYWKAHIEEYIRWYTRFWHIETGIQ